jgi:uncharacterized protein YceK
VADIKLAAWCSAPLPCRAGQGRADGCGQAAVRVGGDQGDAGQAAGGQVAEEREPSGAVLGGGDLQAEDLPVALRVDTATGTAQVDK